MNAFLKLFDEKRYPLIMSLPENDADLAEAAFDAGADAVKVHVNLVHHASQTHFNTVDTHREAFDRIFARRRGPLGIVLGNTPEIVAETYQKTLAYPFDFISLYACHTPPAVLDLPQAKMLACDAQNTRDEVSCFRAMGADVLEASVIPQEGYGRPLEMLDLIRYRLLSQSSQLPVVVPTQRAIRPEELGRLFGAGVRGIMIGTIVTGAEKKSIYGAVRAFRSAIDRL